VTEIFLPLLWYIGSFLVVWWGAGLVVSSISRLASNLRLPAFTISFFVLGLLTSLPEFIIGLTAINSGDPGIFVGNLIGGVVVLFLFIIPLLGLTNGGLKIPSQINRFVLISTLLVAFIPTFLISDQRLETWEGFVAVAAYLALFFIFSKHKAFAEKLKTKLTKHKSTTYYDLAKIMVGIMMLVLASRQIVESTVFLANVLQIAPFFVSLIAVALGTNIPELSIVFRSIYRKKSEVAFADLLGSASANTFLFGLLTLFYQKGISIPNNFAHRFIFIAIGLILMYFFVRSKNKLSRSESAVLLLLYLGFVIVELLIN